MKILHVTTGYNHGGAAIACKRLVKAQRNLGLEAMILTQEPGDFPDYVYSTTNSKNKKRLNFIRLAWEKFVFLFYQSSGSLRFQYSLSNTGENIFTNKLIQQADIIHLHWINGGFISLEGLEKIVILGKPVVWTMHDIWPFTGGCHIAGSCHNFKDNCQQCYYLNKFFYNVVSKRQLNQKKQLYNAFQFSFICPSKKHYERAMESSLLRGKDVHVIPNIIPAWNFSYSKEECRKRLSIPLGKIIISFGAYNINAEHKGIKLLFEALGMLKLDFEIELLVFGKHAEDIKTLGFKINHMGLTFNDENLYLAYKSSDLYISPSTEESFGLTIGEAMLAGTPVVAFDDTGVTDIIDHKENGYLAKHKDIKDMVKGIKWCLENNNNNELSKKAVQKIENDFNPENVGKQYKIFYESLFNENEANN